MTATHIVQREVGSSIVIFDICAVILWLFCLAHYKQKRPLYFCFIGFIIYYLVDGVIWMSLMRVRVISSPYNPYLVQVWLQLGPGIIHPSFVCLMLEGTFGPNRKEINRLFWVVLFIIVQFAPAFLQKVYKGSSVIAVSRTMDSQRWLFVVLACLGYAYLIYKRVSWQNLGKIFLICAGVETGFEFSLFLSGIRKASLKTILIDCVLEFNVGAGLVVALWRAMFSPIEKSEIDAVLSQKL